MMKRTSQILIVLVYTFSLMSCNNLKTRTTTKSAIADTLVIGYLDLKMVGKQLTPLATGVNNFDSLSKARILLFFESDDYFFCFYNKKRAPDFLSNSYWNRQIPKYLSSQIGLTTIDYTDGPFLTGFYNAKDSIVLHTRDWKAFDRKVIDNAYINYCSITNDAFKLNNDISVGEASKAVLAKLKIKDSFEEKDNYHLVLMKATGQIDNAWYKHWPEHFSDDTNAIVLSFKEEKLICIQYFDFENSEYVFKKTDIFTKAIHYH